MNLASRGIRKVFGGGENKPVVPRPPTAKRPIPASEEYSGPTPEEMFRDLQKKMQEARQKRAQMPSTKAGRRYKDDAVEKQKVYQAKEVVSEREKRSSEEFQRVLSAARKKQHDAEQHHLERKAILQENEQEEYPDFNLDLRNAIIGSIILERPYG